MSAPLDPHVAHLPAETRSTAPNGARRTVEDDLRWLGNELEREEERDALQSVEHDQPADAPGIRLRHIAEIIAERREPNWLLLRVLERNVLAVLAGARGTFKSFVALDWSLRAARDGHGVVILSGEGAGLDRRVDAWLRSFTDKNTDVRSLPVLALERPVNLNLGSELEAVAAAIRGATFKVKLVVIDTFSKYSAGLKENDNAEVAAFLGSLAQGLRDGIGCTVLLVHHSGHDSERPRGASALMANPDAEYIVNRPDADGMTVTVSRERFKDYAAQPPLAYTARLVELGRMTSYGEPVSSLVLDTSDAPPAKPRGRSKGRGVNQERAVCGFKEWLRVHPGATCIASADWNAVLEGQGIKVRERRADATRYLIDLKVLTHSLGGFTLSPEHL